MQKIETKANYKLCVREILSLSFVFGAYFFEFRGRILVCFVIAYNFNGKYAPEAGKPRMRTAFFTRAGTIRLFPLLFQNGCSQSSRFLPQARRIEGSGDENGQGFVRLTLSMCRVS